MKEKRLRLEGKTAIVTGAGSSGPGVGTGKATAILFAREGAKVAVNSQSTRGQAVVDQIKASGGEGGIVQVADHQRGGREEELDGGQEREERQEGQRPSGETVGAGSAVGGGRR